MWLQDVNKLASLSKADKQLLIWMGFPNPSNSVLSVSLGCRPEFPWGSLQKPLETVGEK